MKNAFELMARILQMPFPWNVWVAALSIVNVAGGIWYFRRPEAQAALAAISIAFVIMTVIYAKRGFVRLLGLGHVVCWLPLVGYFITRLVRGMEDEPYRWWLLSVVVFNTASLVIDVVDVGRYVKGEHRQML